MSKKLIKKVNKSKKEILSDIQLNQNATRIRGLIKDVVFPYLCNGKESIAYNKLFLQSLSGLVTTVYAEREKTVMISELIPRINERLNEIFKISDPKQKKEFDNYVGLFDIIRILSVHDLQFISELPRYIDGMVLQEKGKDSIDTISIDKLLG